MARILLYITLYCCFCLAAKRLLVTKEFDFEEIDVGFDPEKRAEMTARSRGGRAVPQTFMHGRHVGGYDELAARERAGEVEAWLAHEPGTLAPEFLMPETSEP